MSPLWVFVESLSVPGIVILSTEESRHVVSRRLRLQDELTVFDAEGQTALAQIVGLAKKAVEVEVGRIDHSAMPDSGFGLATAIPKGERLSTALQMWTQLGLEVWQPLLCDDSAIRKIDVEAPRLQRILIEACKVARRPWAIPRGVRAGSARHRSSPWCAPLERLRRPVLSRSTLAVQRPVRSTTRLS